MITHSGKRVFPRDHPGFVDEYPTLEDIAIGLSRQSRFAGQVNCFYSVLTHSFACAEMGGDFALDLLLHDAAEAVISDVPTTWKPESLKIMEKDLIAGIYESLGLTYPFPKFKQDEIDRVDFAMLVAEAHILGHAAAEEYWPLGSFDERMNEQVDQAINLVQLNIVRDDSRMLLINADTAVAEFMALYDKLV